MARKKQYIETEVVEKAMKLFWQNGYEATSMQMLEKAMGINKFSIYSSFGSKRGLFLECLKSYQEKTSFLFKQLTSSSKGVADIKDFFYNSVSVCEMEGNHKGCFVTSTYNEFSSKDDEEINAAMTDFMKQLKELFANKLRMDPDKDEVTVEKQANYLLLAKHGLAAASRVNTQEEVRDYIEMTFENV